MLRSVINPQSSRYTVCLTQAQNTPKIYGQAVYTSGERSARLSFLLPQDEACSPATVNLLEDLAQTTGKRGLFNLLADLDEKSAALDCFRRAGFSIYGWQQIWRLPEEKNRLKATDTGWQRARSIDDLTIHSLFQSLVPPLFQSADPLSIQRIPRWVYRQGDDLLAYLECHYGPKGVVVLPLIHPEVKSIDGLIRDIPAAVNTVTKRPVYLAVRSYQTWLEPSLNQWGASASHRHSSLVKRLVVPQRETIPVNNPVLVKSRQAETGLPFLKQVLRKPQPKKDTSEG